VTHEPPQPTGPIQNAGGSYLLAPVESRHEQQSRQLILSAAERVEPGAAVVLGAGECSEIPLAQLVARFERVTLNDLELTPLEKAVAAADLDAEGRKKIETHVADLTGTTQGLLEKLESCLRSAADPNVAVERMAEIVANQTPGGLSLSGPFDLVVASCVLSQLHVGLAHRAAEVFEKFFPGRLEQLSSARHWTDAIHELARRMDARFVDDLAALVAPRGLIYLSESVQMCFVQLTPGGQWQTPGTFRMLRSKDLSDYVGGRLTILERRRWHWVVWPPVAAGQTGRLYDVQALVAGRRDDGGER
jgi:hypothetical protein